MVPPGATVPALVTEPTMVPWPESTPGAFTCTVGLVSWAVRWVESPICRSPALTTVDPNEETPFRTSSPEPCFTSWPEPSMAVSKWPSEVWLNTRVPLSAIAWLVRMVVVDPCSVAPLSMVKVLVSGPLRTRVPASTTVDPTAEVPVRVKVPVPSLASSPEPEIVPA